MTTWPSGVVAAPGWYPDPWGGRWVRYWDGQTWTSQLSAAPLVPVDPRIAQLAEPGRRLAARAIDWTLLTIVALPVYVGFFGALVDLLDELSRDPEATPALGGVVGWYAAIFAVSALSVAYEVVCIHVWGRTLGKKLVGLRVIRLEGDAQVGWGASTGRALVWTFLGGYLIDPIWCLVDKPWRQCLHDKAARTIVLRT